MVMVKMGSFWARCMAEPLFLHGCDAADGQQYGTPLPGQMRHGTTLVVELRRYRGLTRTLQERER